jgi:regulator of protease activity HflC (stomatin/prohibitin superfamily)
MNPITVFLTVACLAVGAGLGAMGYLYAGIAVVIAAIIIASALKMANTWQKFVILRAGKLRGVKGPGLFLIIPVIDRVVAVIDERIHTTAFSAEEALTKDTVPVNVDAIIFWFVHDAQKAALNITNYREAIDRVSQTSLREMIGSSMLSALLSERSAADELLRGEIGRKTNSASERECYALVSHLHHRSRRSFLGRRGYRMRRRSRGHPKSSADYGWPRCRALGTTPFYRAAVV